MAVSVYIRGEVGTGPEQGSAVGNKDSKDTGNRHTSCGGKMDR